VDGPPHSSIARVDRRLVGEVHWIASTPVSFTGAKSITTTSAPASRATSRGRSAHSRRAADHEHPLAVVPELVEQSSSSSPQRSVSDARTGRS
jgi:hypothetical protein